MLLKHKRHSHPSEIEAEWRCHTCGRMYEVYTTLIRHHGRHEIERKINGRWEPFLRPSTDIEQLSKLQND